MKIKSADLAVAMTWRPRPSALRRAFDDPRKVQELDLGVVVVHHTGDARERREFVRGT